MHDYKGDAKPASFSRSVRRLSVLKLPQYVGRTAKRSKQAPQVSEASTGLKRTGPEVDQHTLHCWCDGVTGS